MKALPKQFSHAPLAAAVLLSLTSPAAVQAAEPHNQAEQELEVITVTATRRAESLQDIPVAVTVLKGDELAQNNRNNLSGLTALVPTLNYRTNASNKDASVFIRGVGTISTSPGVEPTVSTVIDGVVYARTGQATLDLYELDRVEVLRGPQGTLFGKNASAGVLNIVTKEPGTETQGYVDASYFGGGNEKRVSTGVSGELSEGYSRGSLSLLWGDYEGNVTNVANDEKVNGYNKKGARGKLVLTPDQDLKITLAADSIKANDTIPLGVAYKFATASYPAGTVTPTNPALVTALSPVLASEENRQINNNLKTEVEDKNQGLSAQVDWQLNGYQLTSISAFRSWDNEQTQDGDRLAAFVPGVAAQSHDNGIVDFSQWSQELRLASPDNELFNYVAGLYLLKTDDDQIYRRDIITTANVPHTGIANYSVGTQSLSAFGESRYQFAKDWRLITGLRLTRDEVDFVHQRVSTSATAVAGIRPNEGGQGETDKSAASGRIGTEWQLDEQVSSYLTYSRGYKGPAFNVFFNAAAVNGDHLALDAETSDSVELGIKSLTFDNKLRLNAALFDTQYSDYQANFRDIVEGTVVTRLINAGEVSTRGFELDFDARLSSQFSLSGAVARIDAKVDKFNIPVGLTPAQIAAANVDGKTLPFSPDWKANLRGNYTFALEQGLYLDLATDYSWQSEAQYDLAQTPDTVQGAYGIWNASVALSDPQAGWRVALLAKNIADTSYASFLQQANGALFRAVPRDDQRYFGIQARYDF